MSYWVDSTDQPSYPALRETISTDVAVIGAGIAGISTARFLAEEGHSVALLDANRIARQTTGHTTAKVTVAHGLRYDYLASAFGERKARLYADANRTALEEMATRVDRANIDCQFTRASAYTYVPTEQKRQQVETEVDAAQRLGLNASFVEDVPAPVDVAAAIRYENQAHFHPRKYLLALLDSFERDGGQIYENTRMTDVETGSPHRLETKDGRVNADDVVVATHFPFTKRLLYTMRTLPGQEYILTVETDGEPPEDLYFSAGAKSHSFRPIPTDDGTMLLVEGRRHPTGLGGDTMDLLREIEQFATSHFEVEDITYRWSAQDYMTMDRVPYIGPISPFSDSLYVVTGFGGWGMTHGTVAGLLLTDLISGRENEWEQLYSPNRLPPLRSLKRLPKAGTNMMKQRVSGHRGLLGREMERVPDLDPGSGAVVSVDGEQLGVYRTDDGEWRAVSGTCTYSGCTLQWNEAGETWDCPCDGSRYTIEGRVIDGPAQEDLQERAISVRHRELASASGTAD
ncbi:FAD-dependent oxidoreductase (plasmid) [Halorientalis pallida]|uniref:FAD-dependent oxidoreductase n=1 Tax=Halorientalis pallida TaxID=2479928 RepID=UPI003C6FB046